MIHEGGVVLVTTYSVVGQGQMLGDKGDETSNRGNI